MRFHDPWMLVLLLLVPLVVGRVRARDRATLCLPTLADLDGVGPGRRARLAWLPIALRGMGAVLLVVALARPQLGKEPTKITSEGIDIMLAVDVSSSMLAEDFELDGTRANRLDAVKVAVREFLAGRSSDRAGLVLFAGRPYLQSPLTLDHGWLLQNLYRAEVGLIEDGTAVGSALATALKHLEASDAKNKVVVLLTDGQSNAGNVKPIDAAKAAKTLGYKVYTIGAGTHGLAPYPGTNMFGQRVYRPVPVDIDEETLKAIAATTGGRYYRATATQRLKEIYAEIDALEKSPFEGLQYLDWHELYIWLALPALIALVGDAWLGETWLRVLP